MINEHSKDCMCHLCLPGEPPSAPPEKTEASVVFLKCPHCGCDTFIEFAIEKTSQGGVRLTNTGDRDYENANNINIDGDYVEVTGYACQGCCKEYKYSEGTLVLPRHNLNKRKEQTTWLITTEPHDQTISG